MAASVANCSAVQRTGFNVLSDVSKQTRAVDQKYRKSHFVCTSSRNMALACDRYDVRLCLVGTLPSKPYTHLNDLGLG